MMSDPCDDLTIPENIRKIHRRAKEGDEETIRKILKNAEDAITYKRDEACTTFWYLWSDWIKIESLNLYKREIRSLIRILKWYGRLKGIPISLPIPDLQNPHPEDFEDCAAETFERLFKTEGIFEGREYEKLKNYLRTVIYRAMLDKIRKELNKLQPKTSDLQNILQDLPDDLQSMKDEAVDIFANEERYQRVLQTRRSSKKSRSIKLERVKYYYEIVKRSLKGEKPSKIEKLLLRMFGGPLPRKSIYDLKTDAFKELWMNIVIDEKFRELKDYIIRKVI